jgi:hypothetical protein
MITLLECADLDAEVIWCTLNPCTADDVVVLWNHSWEQHMQQNPQAVWSLINSTCRRSWPHMILCPVCPLDLDRVNKEQLISGGRTQACAMQSVLQVAMGSSVVLMHVAPTITCPQNTRRRSSIPFSSEVSTPYHGDSHCRRVAASGSWSVHGTCSFEHATLQAGHTFHNRAVLTDIETLTCMHRDQACIWASGTPLVDVPGRRRGSTSQGHTSARCFSSTPALGARHCVAAHATERSERKLHGLAAPENAVGCYWCI